MTSYSWSLPAATSPGTAGARGRVYAFTPALHAATRDFVMTGSVWTPGDPLTELVLGCLWTERGSYAPDPTYGLDYALLDKQAPNLAATWKAEVARGLARFVARQRLTKLRVEVDPPRKGRVIYAVTFADPRASETLPTTLRLAA